MKFMFKALFLLVLALPLLVQPLFAQVDTGTIAGTVRDSSGAAVAGASITAKNVSTGAQRSAQSGSNGQFNIPGVPAGIYEVTVTSTGFANFTSRAEVTVGGTITVDAQLSASNQVTTVGSGGRGRCGGKHSNARTLANRQHPTDGPAS